jgi:hypothetical protein
MYSGSAAAGRQVGFDRACESRRDQPKAEHGEQQIGNRADQGLA